MIETIATDDGPTRRRLGSWLWKLHTSCDAATPRFGGLGLQGSTPEAAIVSVTTYWHQLKSVEMRESDRVYRDYMRLQSHRDSK